MAAASPSPALSSNSTDTPHSAGAAAAAFNFSSPSPSANPGKSQRGLNKPKCIKCGNVARSRCPFHSCKSCCSKAQNPCEIHVLRGNANVADKTASSNSAKVEQQPTDASHSGNRNFLRQLSTTFSQFNNLASPVKTRKPLTRKDAQLINEWRFLKLKEFRDRNIEAENEAFDRYMNNVGLLEQVFCVDSALDGQTEEGSSTMDCDRALDDCNEMLVAGLKQKLRSNPVRVENLRKRIQFIVDQGLKDLSKLEQIDGNGASTEPEEMGKKPKKLKSELPERASALSDLIDKLNKARNQEELKACYLMKSQLGASPMDCDATEKSSPNAENDLLPQNRPCTSYFPRKWFNKVTIDQESLSEINTLFCSLEEIEDL
ncbi:OLC1v1031518C1 [Oldenlandia corymbosa var. corymbosa]|uniref:OLC1v1031518C1 n=1 Tax=Oldenlandia corymbosa var. corymbosa TaxID=529605 RepID=A0AAV1CM01_OLDCO|nr:OLC1v1031518C1 [Oldenlandia corymbosa var. corymbosa]